MQCYRGETGRVKGNMRWGQSGEGGYKEGQLTNTKGLWKRHMEPTVEAS